MHIFRTLMAVSVIAATGSDQVPDLTRIPWETTFDAAKVRAKREKKPILLLQMLGRLDEEHC